MPGTTHAMPGADGGLRLVPQVTKQTGPAGKPVNTRYIASKLDLVNEMYFAILLDRKSAGPMIIACGEGAPRPAAPAGAPPAPPPGRPALSALGRMSCGPSQAAQPCLQAPAAHCKRRSSRAGARSDSSWEVGWPSLRRLCEATRESPCEVRLRRRRRPRAGGTSIEDLAEKFPDKIVKVPVDIREGITDAQARPCAAPRSLASLAARGSICVSSATVSRRAGRAGVGA